MEDIKITNLEAKLYRPEPFGKQMSEITKKYLGFLFVPGMKSRELERRHEMLTRFKSKRRFITKLNNPLTIFGFFIIFIVVTWAVFAPLITVFDYDIEITGIAEGITPWSAPNYLHPLGVSKFGRDVLARLIWGARSSLTMGLFSIIISVTLGTLLGIFSSYQGGIIDNLIMRMVDIIMAFPGLIIVIILISILSTSMQTILLTYGILGIPGYTRLIRGTALQEKNKTYVEAAKVAGANDLKIMFKHILPNCLAPIIVAFTFDIGGIILSLAGLSFLGFSDSSLVEWGTDINYARNHIYDAPWAAFTPGFGILLTVLAFMLVGDGLRDALDPRLQGRK
ncbi:MAG: ABC transporter permease [Candidatus Lokiarchaeota archaeon]|nr:ABC transporter permease [Candidatus Harpocratesius repetitus]